MNKVIRGALLLGAPLLLLILCNSVYADGSLFGHGEEDKLSTVVISGTNGYVNSLSTSNRILGYSVTGTVNAIVGFYDGATFIAEGASLANDMNTVWFPFPRSITVKLEVIVNASTTIVTIYYE